MIIKEAEYQYDAEVAYFLGGLLILKVETLDFENAIEYNKITIETLINFVFR